MHRSLARSPLLVAFFIFASACFTRAGIPQPDILRLTVADARNAWVVVRRPDDRLQVLHTNNGAKTWADVTPPGAAWTKAVSGAFADAVDGDQAEDALLAETFDVFALDSRTLWIAVEYFEAERGTVLIEHSTDGGANWMAYKASMPSDAQFPQIQFVDRLHGFILASSDPGAGHMNKEFSATDDGGKTWIRRAGPGGLGAYYTIGFSFSSPMSGWYAASYHGEPNVPLIRTRDGGDSWQLEEAPVPQGYKSNTFYGTPNPPQFFGRNRKLGVLVITYIQHSPKENDTIESYLTRDCGRHWTIAGTAHHVGDFISFISPQNGWIADGKQLFSTTNSGARWTHVSSTGIPTDQNSFIQELLFCDAKHGWMLIFHNVDIYHASGLLLETRDGGHNWLPSDFGSDR